MKDYIRSLIIGGFMLIATVVTVVLKSNRIAIITGALTVVWLGKAFAEWRRDKK